MRRPASVLMPVMLVALCGAAWPEGLARAAVIRVGQGQSAMEALARAAPGDTLHLAAGTFSGDLVVGLPGLTVEGESGAVVQGSGSGDAIRVTAPDVTIRGLTVRGSGLSLIGKNSGIFVDRTAERAVVAG